MLGSLLMGLTTKEHRAMITVIEHDKKEWSRMAMDAYRNDRNDIGHKFSGLAALRIGERLPVTVYDDAMVAYRRWLIDGINAI